ELDEYTKQIGEFKSISIEEYTRDWKIQRIIERTLQMMIESCADVANHIISSKEFPVPRSYVEIFKILFEKDIIDASLFDRMKNMVKFRNIIVHDYDKIDVSVVVDLLQNHLDDFTAFKSAILPIL
ncbi:MAG: type VII toxin-antitoxin system HepT family RNase toxin, partial [Candidatus Scalindua sp.]